MLLGYQSGMITEKGNLEALYKQLMELAYYQTNGDESMVMEAMENIEVIQERLYQK